MRNETQSAWSGPGSQPGLCADRLYQRQGPQRDAQPFHQRSPQRNAQRYAQHITETSPAVTPNPTHSNYEAGTDGAVENTDNAAGKTVRNAVNDAGNAVRRGVNDVGQAARNIGNDVSNALR